MSRRRHLLKEAAFVQERQAQEGVKLGNNEPFTSPQTNFISHQINLGTDDFSLEYYGSFFGSNALATPTLYNRSAYDTIVEGFFSVYSVSDKNGISKVEFQKNEQVGVNFTESDSSKPIHFVLTRSQKKITVYIYGVKRVTKELSAVKNLSKFYLTVANTPCFVHTRLFNYALSPDEVKALYNSGKPDEYVLPISYKEIGKNRLPITGLGDPGTVKCVITKITDNIFDIQAPTTDSGILYFQPNRLTNGVNYRIKMKIENRGETEIQSQVYPFRDMGFLINAGIGATQELEFYGKASITQYIHIYPPKNSKFRLTILEVTSVGCIAEYLPQNIAPQEVKKDEGTMQAVTNKTITATGTDVRTAIVFSPDFTVNQLYKLTYTVSNYQSGAMLMNADSGYPLTATNGTHTVLFKRRLSDMLYWKNKIELACKDNPRFAFTAEYVEPIMGTSIIDSAKQLPVNGEYLYPLQGSIGGIDLRSGGVPEIIYKPNI